MSTVLISNGTDAVGSPGVGLKGEAAPTCHTHKRHAASASAALPA